MARIYLDARNITAHPAGVARYAMSLIPELVRQAPQHEFVVIRHASNQTPIELLGYDLDEVFVGRAIDTVDNFVLGAATLRQVFNSRGAPDIFHDLFHILPLATPAAAGGARVVVTLHDLVWMDHPHESQPSWWQAESIRAFARAAIPYALDAADRVICVSEPTARRARGWLDGDQFTTIAHGVDPAFFRPAPPPSGLIPTVVGADTPYVVAIGNDKSYKNLDRLIDAFVRVRPTLDRAELVLIGDCDGLASTIAWSGGGAHITRTGFLTDQELRSVLGHARLFVFPSLVEGFGLPVLEAMAMGVPVAVSNLEPMRSVAADAAMRFDPYDTGALADIIAAVIDDDQLYDRLSAKGARRAAEFRWPLAARKTLQVYDELLAS